MRIVFVLPDLPLSGAATRTVQVTEHLVSLGHEVVMTILVPRANQSIERRLSAFGVEVLRLSTTAGLGRVCRTLTKDSATIVHAAMPTAGAVGLCFARLFHLPLVYSYTNCLHIHRPLSRRTPRDRLKSILEGILATRADALHTVSRSVAEQLIEKYPHATNRIYPIPYHMTQPAESDQAHDADPKNLRDACPKLLVVGRLLEHKRVEDAIRATDVIRKRWPRANLVILGEGPDYIRLRELAGQENLHGIVHFVGESSGPGGYFDWADVLVHPSVHEGYPRVFAEALAKRVPIVSIDSPYAREVAKANVNMFIARPFDHSSIAEKVVEALGDIRAAPCWEPDEGSIGDLCEIYQRLLIEAPVSHLASYS